jgi:hypothetical protein
MKEVFQLGEVSGGFINFIVGSGVGVGMYAFKQHLNEQPMTIGGATTAAAFGAVTGGLGGAAIGAAGGGIIGNIAWRPGFIAINSAGQAIAAKN